VDLFNDGRFTNHKINFNRFTGKFSKEISLTFPDTNGTMKTEDTHYSYGQCESIAERRF